VSQSPLAPHGSTPAELRSRIEAERTGRPFLVYRDGGGNQRILDLGEAGAHVTIGRQAGNDIALEWDFEVSRLHAALQRIGSEWTIADEGLSRNGSFVNGERLTGRHRLADGDTVLVGTTLIAFCRPGGLISDSTSPGGVLPTRADLSEAQRRVLTALCRPYGQGRQFATPATNQAIAGELFLGVDAVKSHLRSLFQKFGIEGLPQNQKRARLVALAFQSGLVSDRDLRQPT
jgi:pSer/pThr/pTyr-binding forkhead associated (FHA) protein